MKDLYTGKALPPMKPGVPLVARPPVHDSAMYTLGRAPRGAAAATPPPRTARDVGVQWV